MNHNEEVPDNLKGLGDMLPADMLKMVNELLERVHQADTGHQGNTVFIYAPGSQYVEKQYITSPQPETHPKTHPGPPCVGREKSASELPAPETMVWAVERTIKDGHWWGNISWSVVYRIYQMKGYQGTISQFVRDVSRWPFTMHIRYDCNDDAVGKPIRTGKISRSLDKWAEDGASSQFIILGEALMKALAQFRK